MGVRLSVTSAAVIHQPAECQGEELWNIFVTLLKDSSKKKELWKNPCLAGPVHSVHMLYALILLILILIVGVHDHQNLTVG